MKKHLFNKQSRRQAKLEAIIETACTLISANGAANTSLDDVARVLGVTKPTLYHYVTGKEDLLVKCMERLVAEKETILEAANTQGTSGREKLEIFIRNYAKFSWSDSSGLPGLSLTPEISEKKRLEFNKMNMKLVHRTRAIIQEGIDDGSLTVEDPELLEDFVVSIILWTPIAFLQRRQTLDADKVLEAYLAFLMDGVGTRKTRRS